MAGHQTVNLQAQRQGQVYVQHSAENYNDTPMDLSCSSSVDSTPPVKTCASISSTSADVGRGCPLKQQRGIDSAPSLVPVMSSPQNKPNTASLTWPANGISTYHLVSNIFDCLINSVYGLSDTTEVINNSGKREVDSSFERSSPAKGGCTENSSCDTLSQDACDQPSVAMSFPKTKKQMATSKFSSDQKWLQTEKSFQSVFPADLCPNTESGTKAMTLGELQEKLITKVVENGSISRLLEFGNNKQPDVLVKDEKLCQGQLAVSQSPEGISCGSSSLAPVGDKRAVSTYLSSPPARASSTTSGLVASFLTQTLHFM